MLTRGGLLARLDNEWTHILRDAEIARGPGGLAGSPAAWALLQARNRLPPERADEILYGLLAAHAAGCPSAGRAVLQCMLPAVRTIVRRSRRFYPDGGELEAETAAAMWHAIAAYDLNHRHRVAMRLQGRTLTAVVGDGAPHARGVRASRRPPITEIPIRSDQLSVLAGAAPTPELVGLTGTAIGCLGVVGEVLDVLAWGRARGAISASDAALLARLYAPDPDLPEYAELGSTRGAFQRRVAAEVGLPYPTVRQRASRATRRLARAVACSS